VSEYHLLTIHIDNYIYEIELRPELSFLIMHQFYPVKIYLYKSDCILKIQDTSITCIFNKQSGAIKVITVFKHINESIYVYVVVVILSINCTPKFKKL